MRRIIASWAVTSVTIVALVSGVTARPAAAAQLTDSQCRMLQEAVSSAFEVFGGADAAEDVARDVRELSTRELVPRSLKPALRKVARFFEDLPDLELLERAQRFGELARPLSKIIRYTALRCGGITAPTTSRPLR